MGNTKYVKAPLRWQGALVLDYELDLPPVERDAVRAFERSLALHHGLVITGLAYYAQKGEDAFLTTYEARGEG